MGPSEKPVEISDSETESVNISSVHPEQLIITQVDLESEKEEEQMDPKKCPSLKDLLASRNKGGSSKEAPKTQTPMIPPLPPPIDLGLLAMPNLKKRRPDQELEEGELAPRKENKQQKVTKDPRKKRGNFVDSRGEVEVRQPQRPWAPRLAMDSVAIPYDASIWDTSRGHDNYLVLALQQPLLFPRDMDSIQRTKQPDLFMSLKRDLAMAKCSLTIQVFKIGFFICYVNHILIIPIISMQVTQQIYVAEDWVWSTNNNLNIEIQNRHDVEKALDMVNHEKTQLAEKLKATESAQKNVEAGLKSAEAQAVDQRKELYTT